MDKLADGDYLIFIGMGDHGYEIVNGPVDGRTDYSTRTRSAFRMMLRLGLLREKGETGKMLTAQGEAMRNEALAGLYETRDITAAA